MDQFYYESGYIDESYFVYVAEAEGLIANYIDIGYIDVNYYQGQGAGATLVCDLTEVTGETVEASGSWSSESTVSVVVGKIVTASADASAEFTQSVTVTKIVYIDSSMASESTQVSDVNIVRGFGVGLSSDADCACVNYRVREQACDAGALFNVATSATATVNSFAILDSVSALAADVDRIIGEITVQLTSEFTQSADVRSFTDYQASILAQSSLSATGFNLLDRPRQYFLQQVSSQSRVYIDTDTTKWGTGSVGALGSGFYQGYYTPDYSFGVENFAIDFWIYPKQSNSDVRPLLRTTDERFLLTTLRSWHINIQNLRLTWAATSTSITMPSALSLDTWSHVKIKRDGTVITMLVNGVSQGTTTISNANITPNDATRKPNLYIEGYTLTSEDSAAVLLDNISIQKGSSTDFNLDTSVPFQNVPFDTVYTDTATKVLLNFDGTFDDDVSIVRLAAADITANASLSVTAGTTKNASSVISSTVEISAVISIGYSISAAVASQGFVVAAVAKKVDELAELTTTSGLTCLAGPILAAESLLINESTLTATGLRVKPLAASIASAAEFVVSATAFEGVALLTLPAQASMSVDANYLARFNANIASAITSTVTANVNESAPAFGFQASYPERIEIEVDYSYEYLRQVVDPPLNFAFLFYKLQPITNRKVIEAIAEFPVTSSQNNSAQGTVSFEVYIYGTDGAQSDYYDTYQYTFDLGTVESVINAPLGLSDHSGIVRFELDVRTNNYLRAFIDGVEISLGSPTTEFISRNFVFNPFTPRDRNSSLIKPAALFPNEIVTEELISPNSRNSIDDEEFIGSSVNLYYGPQKYATADLVSIDFATVTASVISVVNLETSNIQSEFTQNVLGDRLRRISSNLSTTASIEISANVVADSIIDNIISQTNISIDGDRFRTVDSQLLSQCQITADASRLRNIESQLTAETTLSAEVERFRTNNISVEVESTIAATITRIRDSSVDTESIATQLTAIGYNATGTVLMESETSVTAVVNKTTDVDSSLDSQYQQTASITKTTGYSAALSAESQLDIESLRIQQVGSDMTASAEIVIDTDISVTRNAESLLTSEIVFDINETLFKNFSSTIVSEFTVNSTVERTRTAGSSMSGTSELTATGGNIRNVQALLPAISIQLTVGEVLRINPFLQIKVPQETRQGTVLPENRVILVEQETRVNIII